MLVQDNLSIEGYSNPMTSANPSLKQIVERSDSNFLSAKYGKVDHTTSKVLSPREMILQGNSLHVLTNESSKIIQEKVGMFLKKRTVRQVSKNRPKLVPRSLHQFHTNRRTDIPYSKQ